MLSALSAEQTEFLVVGAYAMAAHGLPRATGDIDIWVRPTEENAKRVWAALKRFRCPMFDLTVEDLHAPDIVFQIGIAPNRIDILTSITGVDFDTAWSERREVDLGGQVASVLSRSHLTQNKIATGRPKDLADVAWLEQTASDAAEP